VVRTPRCGLHVEPDLVIGEKVVALAGQAHVVIAIETDLARPAGDARTKRRDCSPLRGLASPCADAPPMRRTSTVTATSGTFKTLPPDAAPRSVLGRAIDQHVAVFARNGERDLAFEIENALAADGRRPLMRFSAFAARRRYVRGGTQQSGRIRTPVFERIIDGHAMRSGDAQPWQALRRGALRRAFSPPRRTRLTMETRLLPETNTGVVAREALTSLTPGYPGGQNRDHPGRRAHRVRSTPSNCPAATGAPSDREYAAAFGSRMSSMKVAPPGHVSARNRAASSAHDAQPQLFRAQIKSVPTLGNLPDADDAGLVRWCAADLGQGTAQAARRRVKR